MKLPVGYSATGEYNIWRHMRSRCHLPTCDGFKYYGARGITVCDRWRNSFANFLEDVGPRPTPKHTIDRHPDNDGNYELGNVRWATRKQQMENTRRTKRAVVDGDITHVAEACRRLGLNEDAVRYRLRVGWDVQRALETPFGKHVVLGQKDRQKIRLIRNKSQDQIAVMFGISQSAVSSIIRGKR
jgi:Helix-turn-helix